jgi:hypothetical protein
MLLVLLGWLILFRPYPSDGFNIYARNITSSLVGIPLFTASMFGVRDPALWASEIFAA